MASIPKDDVLSLGETILTGLNTRWMKLTYPFSKFGSGVSIHYSSDLRRCVSNRISIGDSVYIAEGNWLNVPERSADSSPVLILGDGCKIGRRCMFSAKNCVHLEGDVLLGPEVLITDHSHEFSDVKRPIHEQGLTAGGRIRVERNCWIGFGASIICSSGEIVIGRNTVIGARSVVTRSVPPFCVVAGNPARVVRRYDPASNQWFAEKSPSGLTLA
jgi:abequosyltransferase